MTVSSPVPVTTVEMLIVIESLVYVVSVITGSAVGVRSVAGSAGRGARPGGGGGAGESPPAPRRTRLRSESLAAIAASSLPTSADTVWTSLAARAAASYAATSWISTWSITYSSRAQ